MARIRRVELFHPGEVAAVHVMSRVVRRCFLMGDDPVSGKNYDHRKEWIEELIECFASCFGIDLIAFSLLSNHMHLVLRSRPDVVESWTDRDVALRWLKICQRRSSEGSENATEAAVNSICSDEDRLRELRSRLSDISWWMRLLCQRISVRANREDHAKGRFRAVRLLDQEALLACAAYVDLNPIRAALASSIEQSDFTSAQRRCQALQQQVQPETGSSSSTLTETNSVRVGLRDALLCPVHSDERSQAPVGPMPSESPARCSDKGWASLTEAEYLQLLDWTARQVVPGKVGAISAETPPIFERLKLQRDTWCALVSQFGVLFSLVAGQPHRIDEYRTRLRRHRFNMKSETRQLLA